jgi:proline iminopeptidase
MQTTPRNKFVRILKLKTIIKMKKQLLLLGLTVVFLALSSACETQELTEPGALVPKTVDEDSSIPSITVNDAMLHSETYGDPSNTMIVVLHGGPGSDYRSLLNCKALADDGYYVVFYDQRGSGLSQRFDAGVYTIQLFIDDLDGVINYYRHDPSQKVILMGHSWGAMLATAYVNEYPDRIGGMILMEPGGVTWEDTKAYISRLRSLDLFGETTNDYLYLDQFLTGHDHEVLDYKAKLSSAADFADGNPAGNAGPYPFWRIGAVCNSASLNYAVEHSFDFTTNLNLYETKVLFVYSELNQAYGKTHAEKVSSGYPNVKLVEINGVGHEIPYFGWGKVYPEIVSYLNEINQ